MKKALGRNIFIKSELLILCYSLSRTVKSYWRYVYKCRVTTFPNIFVRAAAKTGLSLHHKTQFLTTFALFWCIHVHLTTFVKNPIKIRIFVLFFKERSINQLTGLVIIEIAIASWLVIAILTKKRYYQLTVISDFNVKSLLPVNWQYSGPFRFFKQSGLLKIIPGFRATLNFSGPARWSTYKCLYPLWFADMSEEISSPSNTLAYIRRRLIG